MTRTVAYIDFDEVLTRIGALKRFQIFHYVLLGIAGIPSGMHALANVFLAGTPDHWCSVPELVNVSKYTVKDISAPSTEEELGTCEVYDVDYSQVDVTYYVDNNVTSPFANLTTRTCSQYSYDYSLYGNTIVSEWDLVCSRAWMRALAQSIYMLGFLVGAIGFGSLSDRIGRRLSWFIATIFLVVSGVAAAFVPNYWAHVWLRFISGAAAGGAYTCAFVLNMEIIGVEKRMIPGIMYQGWFGVGYMAEAWMAHFIRDYFTLQLVISLIPGFTLIFYWLINESPRWLITQGRYEEAAQVVKRAARMNGVEYPRDLMEPALTTPLKERASMVTKEEEETEKYSLADLLKTPNMRKKSLNLFFNWFVNSMVYYGLAMASADLAGTPYLNLFISGIAEFVGFFICIATVDRIGRRLPLAGLMVVGGVACLLTLLVPSRLWVLETVFASIGKMGISGSFALVYVFSAELFPTVVRTIGVGAGSMHARIGGLVAPFIAELGKLVWPPLPIIIFGASSVVAGLLALLLPETLDKPLPETLEDGEAFGKDHQINCIPCLKSNGNKQAVVMEQVASSMGELHFTAKDVAAARESIV